MDHRGSFQAQGKALQKSEPWSQNSALTFIEGKVLLTKLENKLSPKDRRIRRVPFTECRQTIVRIHEGGGYDVSSAGKYYSKSFLADGTKSERVDLEIRLGKALI